MYPPVFATLAANAGVTAKLGASPVRLYPAGEAPQDTATPYAVHQLVTGSPENYLACRPDVDSYSVQFDVYASTVYEAQQVAEALRDAIEPVAYVTRWGGEMRDADTRLYRYSFDVSWIAQR